MKKKSDAVKDGIQFLESITQFMGKTPKYIRLDNSGENTKLQQVVKKKYPNIIFEFTASNTPKQNGRIESEIALTWNQTRTLLDRVDLPKQIVKKLWCEAFKTAIMVDAITVRRDEYLCPDEKWQKELPRWSQN